MMALQIAAGGAAGLLVGWLAWLAARRFVSGYRTEKPSDLETPAGEDVAATRPDGSVSGAGTTLVIAVVIAFMTLWSAYVGWQATSPAVAVSALLVTALLLCIALVDFQVRRIPNALVLALLAAAAVQVIWLGQPTLAAAALGALLAGGIFLLLRILSRGTMGMGDVKLALALGALLGYTAILPAMLAGIVAGGLVALILLLTKRVGRKDPIAYGPYLALGAWLLLVPAWGLWPMQLCG